MLPVFAYYNNKEFVSAYTVYLMSLEDIYERRRYILKESVSCDMSLSVVYYLKSVDVYEEYTEGKISLLPSEIQLMSDKEAIANAQQTDTNSGGKKKKKK